MKARLLSSSLIARRAVALCVGGSIFAIEQAAACPFCYGAKDGKSTEHMAVAIWFLFGAIMAVMSGIGAFSYHLYKMGRTPLEPHQELTEEDLDKYV
jgi:hypothetical protein